MDVHERYKERGREDCSVALTVAGGGEGVLEGKGASLRSVERSFVVNNQRDARYE